MRLLRGIALGCALALCVAGAGHATAYVDSEIARVDDLAPGTGGGTFSFLEHTRINDAGDVAFYARARTGGSDPAGLFIREGDFYRVAVSEDD